MKKFAIGLASLAIVFVAAAFLFQKQIATKLFERAVAAALTRNSLTGLDDGLHLGLCGTGSPMANLTRAGPCNVVIAGDQVFVVDIGEGGNEVLTTMGINTSDVDALLLTHFHSDHVDGIGPLMLYHWTRGASTRPLPVFGPTGVEAVVQGFNAAYATDNTYRIAHHGETVVPANGGGGQAFPFAVPETSAVILQRGGLTVTAFKVEHDPVEPAVGYRFDYKGRALCISGDTVRSANLEKTCAGADIIVHDALQPALVEQLRIAMADAGQSGPASIFDDIQDYHASPEDAAASAAAANAGMLVLSHLVPPLPYSYLYPAFVGNAGELFSGPIVVGEDGMLFSLLPGGKTIKRSSLL